MKASNSRWTKQLAGEMPENLAREIDIFEAEIALRKQGKLDERLFAETRLRRGAYGQRYDNGHRHNGKTVQQITQIVQAVCIGGIALDRDLIGGPRLGQPPLGFEHAGKPAMAGAILRLQGDGTAKARLGLAPSAQQAKAHGAAMMKSGIIGAAQQRLLAGRDYLGRLA